MAGLRIQPQRTAAATGLPIRYTDIVLVVFDQVASPELGIVNGVCLNAPRCDVCSIRRYCGFPASVDGFAAQHDLI